MYVALYLFQMSFDDHLLFQNIDTIVGVLKMFLLLNLMLWIGVGKYYYPDVQRAVIQLPAECG